MRIRMTAPILIAALTLATAAIGQPVASRQTRDFLQAAGEADTFEIMEAQTAFAQSKDPQVLAFARQMIHDHSETRRKLRAAAQRSGAEPPGDLVGTGQSPFLAALQSLRGADFDKAYWNQQALAHRAALVTQQDYASTGDLPAIRSVAAGAVPLIQSHLKMAEQMQAESSQP